MATPVPNLSPGSQQGANVQIVVSTLQNLVQAVNALTAQVATQFNSNGLYSVSNLPAASAPARAFVSDSTVVASGNFGAAVVGGGTHFVPVYWDSAVWRIG